MTGSVMSGTSVLLQQAINGLSLGAMYALLALGFTLVYGIMELINFAHFNVFMVSSFVGMWALELLGIHGQGRGPRFRVLHDDGLGRHTRRRHRAPFAAALARGARHRGDDHDDRRLLHPVQQHPADDRRRLTELPRPAAGRSLAFRRCHSEPEGGADLGHRPSFDARA